MILGSSLGGGGSERGAPRRAGGRRRQWRRSFCTTNCDSVSLTRVKPAVRCAERPAPASIVGDALVTATTTNSNRREHEVEDDGDRDANAFPRTHICALKGCQILKNVELVAKLLEAIFFCFANFFRMPTSFKLRCS
jgi:hypothetical protein